MNHPLLVTIDTNIFEAAKFDFGKESTLRQICKHVKDKRIKVFLSDIVKKEVESHIREKVKEAHKELMGTSKTIKKLYTGSHRLNEKLDDFLKRKAIEEELIHIEIKAFNKFLKDIGAKIVEKKEMDSKDIEEVFDAYFKMEAPFENRKEKRKEFPDAFIVRQILRFCEKKANNSRCVAVVSDDKGFIEACKEVCKDNNNGVELVDFKSLKELFDAIIKMTDIVMYNEIKKRIADNIEKIKELIYLALTKDDDDDEDDDDDDDDVDDDAVCKVIGGEIPVAYKGREYLFDCNEIWITDAQDIEVSKTEIIKIEEIESETKRKRVKVLFTVTCDASIYAEGEYFATELSIKEKPVLECDDPVEFVTKHRVELKCDFEFDPDSDCLKFKLKSIEDEILLNKDSQDRFRKWEKSND